MFARPSTVPSPIVSALQSSDMDYICENFPNYTESIIVLFPLVIVAISIKNNF